MAEVREFDFQLIYVREHVRIYQAGIQYLKSPIKELHIINSIPVYARPDYLVIFPFLFKKVNVSIFLH